jgi:hypothetical protein
MANQPYLPDDFADAREHEDQRRARLLQDFLAGAICLDETPAWAVPGMDERDVHNALHDFWHLEAAFAADR